MDTVYNPLGEVASVSNPYFTTSDPTYGITQTHYDALGRVSQVTAQDGSVSKIDYSQYPTVTTTDPAGNMRRTRTDALGRLVEVDEPGAGASTPGAGATGSISISGSLASSTSSGTKATGSFTVNGTEGGPLPTWICSDTCVKGPVVYDRGLVTVNNRLQINSMTDVEGASTLFSKSYGYYDGSGHNNGNVLTITDALNSAPNQTFTYDQLNRLASAAESDNDLTSATVNLKPRLP